MESSEKEQKVIDIVNEMISVCEPFTYKDFNLAVKAKDIRLRQIERKCNKVGMANYGKDNEGFSTLSLIATITDILVDRRLSFQIDKNGVIVGVQWYDVKGIDPHVLEELKLRQERNPFARIDFRLMKSEMQEKEE